MKRWIAFAFAIVCVLSLAGCGGKETQEAGTGETNLSSAEPVQPQKSPPALTVTCGGQSTVALSGTYSWQYDNGDGTMTGVEACGGGALFELEWMTPLSRNGSESVTLDFAVEPESISVRCWNDEYANDANSYAANYTELTCENGTVEIPTDGSYIYEVYAQWGAGNAYYSFYIVDFSYCGLTE